MLQAFSEENNQIITLQVILNFMYSQGFPYHNLSHMVIFISPLKLSIQQIQHGSDALGYTPTGDRMEGSRFGPLSRIRYIEVYDEEGVNQVLSDISQ